MDVLRACRLGGVLLTILLVAACSRSQPDVGTNLAGSGAGDEGPVTPGSAREFSVRVGDTVYFTTDSSELSADATEVLAGQARWLRQYPRYAIVIEGHADERGTREYNIALGARRAAAVRQYLGSQGVNPDRIRTISYGKERPVAICDNITCWSQNRRAVTVLDRQGTGPVAGY